MWKFLRVLLWTSLFVAALIGVLRYTVIRWWQVPLNDPYFDASIAPTLNGGDWVILWRGSSPKFGDLVLCPEPKTNRPVIARVAAEQGDHLKISNTSLTINNAPLQVDGTCDAFHARDPLSGGDIAQTCSLEVMGGRTHKRGNTPSETTVKPTDTDVDVAAGQIFLVSDNRALSWDSRDFGPVERSSCTETVVFRLVSKDGFFDVPNRLSLIR